LPTCFVIKAGLIAYEQGRVALTELNEHTGDIMGEARSEIAEVGKGTSHPGA
jgi:hypothetical protein